VAAVSAASRAPYRGIVIMGAILPTT
jgi:hypothetical protein